MIDYCIRLFRFFCIALLGACVLTVLNVVTVTGILVAVVYLFH